MKKFLMTLALALSLTTVAFAETGKASVGAALGYVTLGGDMDAFDPAIGYGVTGAYGVTNEIDVEATVLMSSHEQKIDLGYSTYTAKMDLTQLLVDGRYTFVPGPTKVYGKAGLGLYQYGGNYSGSDYGINVGVGADYKINDQISVGADASYHHIMVEVGSGSAMDILLNAKYNF